MTAFTALPPSLTTERLTLGPWRDEDVDAYGAMVTERDPRTAAAPRTPLSRAQLAEAVSRQQAALTAHGICLYVIRVDDEFVGYCGLIVGRSTLDEPEIGYELLQRFHGRGYATEAARAVVAAAADTGRRRLWASVRDWNAPSFRVLTKVGFGATERTTVDDFGVLVWWTREP
jgi:RimJ/RimL family protein N-acetyltransferase